MKTGILLINLGSPNGPNPQDVGPYLKQFLMDPHVIDLPTPLRWFLVNGVIVPFRKYRSAKAYAKVWTAEGSPLIHINRKLAEKVQGKLGEGYMVELAMRYGSPSIEDALHRFREKGAEIGKIITIPLYPQYAASSTETAIQESMRVATALQMERKLEIVPAFYDRPEFIEPCVEIINEEIEEFKPDHLLFSYHGLPMKAVGKECEKANHCFSAFNRCPKIDLGNKNCYRAQCYATTEAIQRKINFPTADCSVAFQSRLSKNWIQPFSDARVEELARLGKKRLAVVCPSFTADCLETLEEVAIGFREAFQANGGEELMLIPAVNFSDSWVTGLSKLLENSVR